jgi:hypothetical protein
MDLSNVAIKFARELRDLSKDEGKPYKQRQVAARLADALLRPLVLGVFGEFGAGQFGLINTLLRHRACPPELALGRRPATLIRYAETPAMFAIKRNAPKSRLNSHGVAQIAQSHSSAARQGARVIYEARKRYSGAAQPAREPALRAGRKDDADDISAIEILLPLPVLAKLEICEMAADEPFVKTPQFSRLPVRRQPDIAAWVTLANGAWKHSEFMTWKSISFPSSKPALLLVTDNESLTDDTRARLDARLKDSTQSDFSERRYLSLGKAATLLGSREPISEREWQATGVLEFETMLSALLGRIWSRKLERARRILQALDRGAPESGRSMAGKLRS